jgi:hypothetical protein
VKDNVDDTPDRHDGQPLGGLDGTNPLGFMAALGAFRLLSLTHPNVRMAWRIEDGTWHPALFGFQVPIAEFGNELRVALGKVDQSVWSLDRKLPFSASRLREEACSAVAGASWNDRERADAVASLGVECYCDDKGNFEDTAFRMVRSGDSKHRGLLFYGKRILESTTARQLQQAITGVWQYEDEQCGLRWDPAEHRGYALQWRNPSDVGALSVKGANCLALVALALFPTAPVKGEAETTGFGLKAPKQSSFTWPIWHPAVSMDTGRSLLGLPMLQREQPPRAELDQRGIVAVYRCDRVMTSTYYSNFTPARRVV